MTIARLDIILEAHFVIALDAEVVIDYDLEPACRGSRDRFGLQMEPDTDASICINSAVIEINGVTVHTFTDFADLEPGVWEHIAIEHDMAAEYAAEARFDEREFA